MTYKNPDPNCHDCQGEGTLESFDPTCEVICRCRTSYGGVAFRRLVKRLTVERDAKFTSKDGETPWGWFHINRNWWGWTISELSDFDREWFASQGVSTDNVFRTVSESGLWNVAHFNFKTGTFAFMDGEHYRNTDEIKWMKHTGYTHVYLDEKFVQEVLKAN